MKGRIWKVTVLVLAALVLLNACAAGVQDPPTSEENSSMSQEERIAQLETELESLRAKETAYQAQIRTLEDRVAQLSVAKPSPDPLTERVTFHYREENGGAVITGYDGNASILTIPSTLNGLPVTAIGEHAFERANLTAVILPEGIVSIGWFAFYECQELSGVTLPNSVSSIGYAVFDGCPTLTLRCPAGSYAEKYAQSYAIPYINL